MARLERWEKSKSISSKSEFTTLFHELQICWDKGWSYERDWLRMSKRERALWLAFVGVESWRTEEEREERERENALRRAAAL